MYTIYIVHTIQHKYCIFFHWEFSVELSNKFIIYLFSFRPPLFFSHFPHSHSAFVCWVMCDLRYTILLIFLRFPPFSQAESGAVVVLCYELRIQFYLLNVFFLLRFWCLVLLSGYITKRRMRNAFPLSLQIFIGLSRTFFYLYHFVSQAIFRIRSFVPTLNITIFSIICFTNLVRSLILLYPNAFELHFCKLNP